MRTLTYKHNIWGENWLYLRPYLKAFPVFEVLETCRVYVLAAFFIPSFNMLSGYFYVSLNFEEKEVNEHK